MSFHLAACIDYKNRPCSTVSTLQVFDQLANSNTNVKQEQLPQKHNEDTHLSLSHICSDSQRCYKVPSRVGGLEDGECM